MSRNYFKVAALVCAVLFGSRSLRAQLPIPSVSVMGGVSHYNLSGTGTSPFGAIRVDVPLLFALVEGSFGAFRPNENGVHRTYIIPEAQLQWQLLPILIKPYIGVGGGLFRAVNGPTPQRNDLTISASAGIRVGIPLTGIGVRAEARLRSVGSGFGVNATELLLGGSW